MSETERSTQQPGFGEFVALMAMMTALVALSIDTMLPALPQIGEELGVERENSTQMVISLIFVGLAAGQMLFGPLSDSIGRKPAIYAGYFLFAIGCLLSFFAMNFQVMLMGRLIQGFGIAGPRSVTIALIRDRYEGRAMAQVMSFIMTVFILVPVIAPSFGQAVLLVAGWRAIFVSFLLMALITGIWFALRQPETLPHERRMPFSLRRIGAAVNEVLHTRIALGYTIAAGLLSGAFLGYLNSAQQIFQIQYGLGTRFPIYFAVLSLAFGAASLLNSRLVMRYGMRTMSNLAAQTLTGIGLLFFVFAWTMSGNPELWMLMLYFLATFFCVGILFGNLNSLAMEPLGHIAGVGAAVVASLSLILATALGIFIGQAYDGTILPLVAGFTILGLLGVGVMRWTQQGSPDVGSYEDNVTPA